MRKGFYVSFVLLTALFIIPGLCFGQQDQTEGSVAGGISQREIDLTGRYLYFPVGADEERRMVQLFIGDSLYRYFQIEIAGPGKDPLYWASVDMGLNTGKRIRLTIDIPAKEDLLAAVEQGEAIRPLPGAYREELRPQFHFSPQVGWTNDPNGLVWQDGEYHLFFQHNPYGVYWGNMTWGHAVSRDLVHWEELGDALHPDELGTIFSGSAVVDHKNTSGFQSSSISPMVTFYTSAGSHAPDKKPFTQSIAYSTDRGRNWSKFEGNPVIPHIEANNRDPKVIWHEKSGQWVMVLYLDRGKFVLFGSGDLKTWTRLSDIEFPGGHECPELFELPVDGDPNNTRWVLWEGSGRHLIGHFDGEKFEPESAVLASEWGPNCYAAQTYNDVPDGRRILIGWMRSGKPGYEKFFPGMPFNQQMAFPRELSLRSSNEGVRLFAEPAREISKLYKGQISKLEVGLTPGTNPLGGISGELFDIELVIDPGAARRIALNVRGTEIVYEAANQNLSCLGKTVQVVPSAAGELELRILIDRTSIEVFAAAGRYVMSFNYSAKTEARPLNLKAVGGTAKIRSLQVRELQSIW